MGLVACSTVVKTLLLCACTHLYFTFKMAELGGSALLSAVCALVLRGNEGVYVWCLDLPI